MDAVSARLVGGECHLVAGGFPGRFLAAPDCIAAAVGDGRSQGRALARGQGAVAADVHRRGVGLHSHGQLRGGEGPVDLDARFEGVGSGSVGRKGQAAAVFLHLVIDGPLHIGGVVGLASQLDGSVDGQALALLDGRVALVQRQFDTGVVEHGLDRDVLRHVVIAGRGGDAVAPLVEYKAIGGYRRHVDTGAGVRLDLHAGNAGLAVAGQGALGAVLHLIAGGELRRGGGGERRAGRAAGGRGSLRDVAGVRAAVHRVIGVGLGVFQQGAGAGGAVPIGFHIAVLGKASAVFQGLGAVQVFEAHVAAGHGNGLVELVNVSLGLGGVGTVLGDRRDGHRDDIRIGVGRVDVLQELLVIGNEGIHTDRSVHIVGAQLHKNTAGFHLGDCLRDRVVVGV